MKVDVVVPRLGSSDESDEVTILKWHKKPGEQLQKGETLVEVETDKVTVAIEAPHSGVLVDTQGKEGEAVSFNSVIAVLEVKNDG